MSKFYMAGTEGTGEYVVVAVSEDGDKLGYRQLGGNKYRVRFEPASTDIGTLLGFAKALDGWKAPGDGGQHRFSTIVTGETEAAAALNEVFNAIGNIDFDRNPSAPVWAKEAFPFYVPEEEVPEEEEATAEQTVNDAMTMLTAAVTVLGKAINAALKK